MNYDWMKYEEIENATYPNLLAEIKESGYSICTVAECMGMGRRPEDDKAVWDKLAGRKKIKTSEVIGLMQLFNVEYEYLFARSLKKDAELPRAKVRWLDWKIKDQVERENRRIEDEWYRIFCNEVAGIVLRCRDMGQEKYANWKKNVADQCPDECREFTVKFLEIIDRRLNNTTGAALIRLSAESEET